MVSRTALACVASPVTGDRSRAERIIDQALQRCSILVQVFPCVGAVKMTDADRGPIEAVEEARIYSHAFLGPIQALPMGRAAAGLAAMESQHAIAPDIGLCRAGLWHAHFGRRIMRPARRQLAADGAVALRHCVRRFAHTEVNSPAMADGLDHSVSPPSPWGTTREALSSPEYLSRARRFFSTEQKRLVGDGAKAGRSGQDPNGRLFLGRWTRALGRSLSFLQDGRKAHHGLSASRGVDDQPADENHAAPGLHHFACALHQIADTCRAHEFAVEGRSDATRSRDRLLRDPKKAKVGEGHDAAAVHEHAAVHMFALGAERANTPPGVVDAAIERS